MKRFKGGGENLNGVCWRGYDSSLRSSGREDGLRFLWRRVIPSTSFPFAFFPLQGMETSSHFYCFKKHFILPQAPVLSWAYLRKKSVLCTTPRGRKISCLAEGDRGGQRGGQSKPCPPVRVWKSMSTLCCLVSLQRQRCWGRHTNGAAQTEGEFCGSALYTVHSLREFHYILGSAVCALSGQSDRISWPSVDVGLATCWCFNCYIPLSTGNGLFWVKIKFWQWGFASVEMFIFGIMELLTWFFPMSLRSDICILCYPRLSWCNSRENTSISHLSFAWTVFYWCVCVLWLHRI